MPTRDAIEQNLQVLLERRPKLKRILVVDDDRDYARIVAFLLRKNSYEVEEAGDGAEALRLAIASPPDLVLLDYRLPSLNGYELLEQLRMHPETRIIPVIMFTGVDRHRHLKGLLAQLCDFLEKPVPNERLLASVAKALGVDPKAQALKGTSRAEAPAPTPAPAPVEPADDEMIELEALERRKEEDGLEGLANDSPLINRVNKILLRSFELGASDVHIEAQENETTVRIRVNGSLQRLCGIPRSLHKRLTARLKIMANLVITEHRLPQDGQIRAKIKGSRVEFRVSTLPSQHGEKIVLRILGAQKILDSLSELGMTPRDLLCVESAIQVPHGLILLTGPTGSGKSTTLYTMIRALNKPDVNILTVEDPVEYELPGITQVLVRPGIGLTFEKAVRAFLRQDPDVMLIGEIRDLETAQIAVKASITGRLVLSTLHTNSAPAAAMRLTQMGLAPYLVAASVRLIVAQRLIKKLCPECRVPAPLPDEALRLLSEPEAAALGQVYRSAGCAACAQTGCAGRRPIFEVMPVASLDMRRAILSGQDSDSLTGVAADEGMTTMRQAALRAVAAGETSFAEAARIVMGE